jgi:hypothetical protein
MGVSGQRHAPAALNPQGRTPGTHCTGGWVGPRAGLDTEARGKILCPRRDRTPVAQPVVRHYTELTRLHVELNTSWKVNSGSDRQEILLLCNPKVDSNWIKLLKRMWETFFSLTLIIWARIFGQILQIHCLIFYTQVAVHDMEKWMKVGTWKLRGEERVWVRRRSRFREDEAFVI